MNIYALEGHKVKYSTFNAGYIGEREIVKKHLILGDEYTIEDTYVHNSYTDVFLKEIPNVRFNSVFFEDIDEQSDKDNMKHPDWVKYNS
jgi:hypothetical protein